MHRIKDHIRSKGCRVDSVVGGKVDVAMFKVSREIYEPLKDRFNGNLIARDSASFRTMIIKYNKMLDAIRFFRMFLFPLETNDNAMRDGG